MKFYKAALHIAVEKGYTEIVRLLLQGKYIDINVKDNIFINNVKSSYIFFLYDFMLIYEKDLLIMLMIHISKKC